jgi:subtilisin-like proprotein convertase family protein
MTNRAGAEVLVHDGTAADDGHDLVIDRAILGFSGDEAVNGDWTLIVQDRAGGQVGTIQGWELTLGSRWD